MIFMSAKTDRAAAEEEAAAAAKEEAGAEKVECYLKYSGDVW